MTTTQDVAQPKVVLAQPNSIPRPKPRPSLPHDDWSYLDEIPRPKRLHHVFEQAADTVPDATALVVGDDSFTYAELDELSNQLANLLRQEHGIGSGSTVGILIERSVPMYVAILAALKSGAKYVPIDSKAPLDRVEYITADAGVDILLTSNAKVHLSDGLPLKQLLIDDLGATLHGSDSARPQLPIDDDPVAYIIYTSGSTGRPKGVAIAHSSVCNAVVVVTELYGVHPTDRVYQGLSISFDFSLEEFWTTWGAGATLVAGPTDGRQVGSGLTGFLEENRITFVHAVPTVLATLDRDLPLIRTLNLGGEACPQELVERWGPGRRILNTYGPTEATISCTWAVVKPGVPITIGVGMPTYEVTLRDEDFRIVPDGEVGELCVSGIGVAVGYVGLDELTAQKFVFDEQGRRTYLTGDLGRLNHANEIEYLGRKDAEVKILGHRVDLGEIESVVMSLPEVSVCVVNKRTGEDTGDELVAYVLAMPGVEGTRELAAQIHDHCRLQLPPYMVADYVEFIETVPLMPSGKVNRNALPTPVHPRLISGLVKFAPPSTPTEVKLVELWSVLLKIPADALSVDADLFTDLGGHSLIAATLVSRLRASSIPGTDDLSIPDLYAQPTVRTISEFIDAAAATSPTTEAQEAVRRRYPAAKIWLFGFFQFSYIYLIVTISMFPIAVIYWLAGGYPSRRMLFQILASIPVSYLLTRWLLPVITCKLLGRGLREGEYPLYSPTHLRVWVIQRALSLSPLQNLAGSHLIAPYLRMVGAKIGDASQIGSEQIPLPSLLEVGDNVTVGRGVHLCTFEIEDGLLHLGRITLGDNAIVTSNCVLIGNCSVGKDAVLRPQSLLRHGEHIPPGQEWSGSCAEPLRTRTDPALATMRRCADAPREWSSDLKLKMVAGIAFLEFLPLLAIAPAVFLVWWLLLTYDHRPALLATLASGLIFVVTACALILWYRRFAMQVVPVDVHHTRTLLGVEKWFNDKLLDASLEYTNALFGTLYTPHWLRMLGARIGRDAEVATIAGFDPDLLTMKDGTFVADMATVGSTTYANGHIAFRKTVVEDRAFIGNASFIPSGSHLETNSLVGVLSVPPVQGVPEGTSWLGNPPIFLPKRETFDQFSEDTTYHPPRSKVIARYIIEFFRVILPATLLGLSTFYTLTAIALLTRQGWSLAELIAIQALIALSGSLMVTLVIALMKWVLVGRYKPRIAPLWGNFVRRTEFLTGIYETAAVPAALGLVQGTPMLNPLLRLFGAKVGKRCLIDTTYMSEFDLVRIGDDVTVGSTVSLQTHLFEDRIMKMGYVTIDSGASVSTRSIILYGATVGEDVHVSPLTLVMKGEALPANTGWAGIPARRDHRPRLGRTLQGAPAETYPDKGEPGLTLDVSELQNPVEQEEVPVLVPHPDVDPVEVAALAAESDRVIGFDLARALALLGIMFVNITPSVTPSDSMSWLWRISTGNSMALFAVLAGVGVAITTRKAGRRRRAGLVTDWASIFTQAVLLFGIGLVMATFVPRQLAEVVLPYLAVLLLLALPFVRTPPWLMVILAALVALFVPIWSHIVRQFLPTATASNIDFPAVFTDPTGVLVKLLLTGAYPALAWLAYVLVGMAIGRIGISRSSSVVLLAFGIVVAAITAGVSSILMRQMGGLDALGAVAQETMPLDEFTKLLVLGAEGTLPTTSTWWLAVIAPRTTTPFDLFFTIGILMFVLGGLVNVGFVLPRFVKPISIFGSMPLTGYTLHLVMMTIPPLQDGWIGYLIQVAILVVFVWFWSRFAQHGPLESVVRSSVLGVRSLIGRIEEVRNGSSATGDRL